jgi:hypothetical protein
MQSNAIEQPSTELPIKNLFADDDSPLLAAVMDDFILGIKKVFSTRQ